MKRKVTAAQAPHDPRSACKPSASAVPSSPPPSPTYVDCSRASGARRNAAAVISARKRMAKPAGRCHDMLGMRSIARIINHRPSAPVTKGMPQTPLPNRLRNRPTQPSVTPPRLPVTKLSKVNTAIKTRAAPSTSARSSDEAQSPPDALLRPPALLLDLAGCLGCALGAGFLVCLAGLPDLDALLAILLLRCAHSAPNGTYVQTIIAQPPGTGKAFRAQPSVR